MWVNAKSVEVTTNILLNFLCCMFIFVYFLCGYSITIYSRWRPRWPLMWPVANTQLKPTATGTSHRVCHTVNRSSDITWPTTLHPRNEKLPLQPGLLKPTVLTSDLWGFTDARRTTVPNAQQLYIRSSMFKVWPRGQLLPMVKFYTAHNHCQKVTQNVHLQFIPMVNCKTVGTT